MQPEDIATDLLRAYARRFINRWDRFMVGTADGRWHGCQGLLTETHLRHAVAGQTSLGAYAIDHNGMSRWACLDLDDTVRGDFFLGVIAQLEHPSQALLEYSRRGFHLWLFVEPSPWFVVEWWAKELADRAGLQGIEIFPKGAGLTGVRLPLSRHPKSGQVYPLIDTTTGELVEDPLAFIVNRTACTFDLERMASSPASPPLRRRVTAGRGDHRALVKEIERYTRLRFYGPEQAVGRCPLHDDQHPSLGVLGGFWRCFAGCGEGGLNAFRARMREKGGLSWPQQR
jgi:hypothetical protein